MLLGMGIYGYLYFSYIRIYDTIGNTHLTPPYKYNSFTIGNSKGEGKAKYVAMGDSLSAGVGATTVDKTIVYLFAEHLSKKYWQVNTVNYAWPGDESKDVLKNQLPQALAQNPDYVTVFIGINDIHNKREFSDYRLNMLSILDSLLVSTHAQIYVVNLPYLGANKLVVFPYSNILDIRTKQFNSILESVCQNDRIHLIDLYSGSRDKLNSEKDNYAVDLFHPSDKGYLLWSKIINGD